MNPGPAAGESGGGRSQHRAASDGIDERAAPQTGWEFLVTPRDPRPKPASSKRTRGCGDLNHFVIHDYTHKTKSMGFFII